MAAVLTEVLEHLQGEVDVKDGSDGPVPNAAMRISTWIDDVLSDYRKQQKREEAERTLMEFVREHASIPYTLEGVDRG